MLRLLFVVCAFFSIARCFRAVPIKCVYQQNYTQYPSPYNNPFSSTAIGFAGATCVILCEIDVPGLVNSVPEAFVAYSLDARYHVG
jgi:hypothetical protein